MEVLSFYLLVAASCVVLAVGFSKRAAYLELPTLFSTVYLGWVIPQLWQIRQYVSVDEVDYLITLNLFCLVCLLGVVFGWRLAVSNGLSRPVTHSFFGPPSYQVLIRMATFSTIFVWAMSIGIGMQDLDERNSSTWSGPITILAFFLNLKSLSFFLSAFLALRYRTGLAYALLALNVVLYLPAVFIYFRRRAMIDMFVCAIFALWFARQIVVPRLIVVGALILGSFVTFGIGALRALARGDGTGEWHTPSLSEITSIDFWSLTPFGAHGATPELMNALTLVRLSDQFGFHTWGGSSWNSFVFQWFPAQIVGADIKSALMFDLGVAEHLYNQFYYAAHTGSTSTGMGDAYLEFGFLGFVFFFSAAYVMGRWWVRASRGDVWAAALYVCGVPLALHTATHYAFYFFNLVLLYGGTLVGFNLLFNSRRV